MNEAIHSINQLVAERDHTNDRIKLETQGAVVQFCNKYGLNFTPSCGSFEFTLARLDGKFDEYADGISTIANKIDPDLVSLLEDQNILPSSCHDKELGGHLDQYLAQIGRWEWYMIRPCSSGGYSYELYKPDPECLCPVTKAMAEWAIAHSSWFGHKLHLWFPYQDGK